MSLGQITSNELDIFTRLQSEIMEARRRIEELELLMHDRTGNEFENAIHTVTGDEMKMYWRQRILDLQELVNRYAKDEPNQAAGIGEGCLVMLAQDNTDKQVKLRVTEHVELFPGEKCVSLQSPVGSALTGKEPGDRVEVVTPGGKKAYIVVDYTKT